MIRKQHTDMMGRSFCCAELGGLLVSTFNPRGRDRESFFLGTLSMCPDTPFSQESGMKFSQTATLLNDSKKVSCHLIHNESETLSDFCVLITDQSGGA